MDEARVGIIGGSGLYDMPLEESRMLRDALRRSGIPAIPISWGSSRDSRWRSWPGTAEDIAFCPPN